MSANDRHGRGDHDRRSRPAPARAPWRQDGPPAAEPERESSLARRIWEWEHPGAAEWRHRLAVGWQRRRPRVQLVALVTLAFLLGAAVSFTRQDVIEAGLLQLQLRRAEQTVTARQGELELVRIELNRLRVIMDMSRRYRIPADLAADIYDIARAEDIDPTIAFSLVRVESGFHSRAISSMGAVGLTQLMPRTALSLEPDLTYEQLFDRHVNLRIGFRYLRQLIDQYHGDMRLALLAYNRGPTRVDSIRNAGGDPNNGYPRAVLGIH